MSYVDEEKATIKEFNKAIRDNYEFIKTLNSDDVYDHEMYDYIKQAIEELVDAYLEYIEKHNVDTLKLPKDIQKILGVNQKGAK